MGVLHHTPNPEKAVEQIFRVLKYGGRLIVMVYYRDSLLYRLKFPLTSLLSGKTVRQLVNEVDGVGNPKGDVYSKAELRQLLYQYQQLEMFTHLLPGSRVLPKIRRFIPDSLIRPFERRWGWFLYAKGRKPEM